jgi:DNA-binding response OmpR family regulator
MSNQLAGNKTVRVLYVDDEVDILRTVQLGLGQLGFSVDIVTCPLDVLKLDYTSYDIILFDLRMPEISGFDLYEKIKDRLDSEKNRVCFFTAFISSINEYNRRYSSWKGSCFLTKPISMRELAVRLRKLVEE